jgi:cobalt/nickel transport system permease protein
MARIDSSVFDLDTLDLLAYRDSAVHRLDPRAKLLTTLVFIIVVISHDKYAFAALLPYLIFPVSLLILADLPAGYLVKKLLLVAPFAFFIGLFNPFLDRAIVLQIGSLPVTGGWLSFGSILLRFALTVGACLILVATTSFQGICYALEKFLAPRVFVLQLLFLYRYLFVLVEQTVRLVRARSLRTFQGRGLGIKSYVPLLGQLLLRSMDRAQRIHLAMLCRGFTGEIYLGRQLRIGPREIVFTLGWSTLFILLRLVNIPQALGTWTTGIFQ